MKEIFYHPDPTALAGIKSADIGLYRARHKQHRDTIRPQKRERQAQKETENSSDSFASRMVAIARSKTISDAAKTGLIYDLRKERKLQKRLEKRSK